MIVTIGLTLIITFLIVLFSIFNAQFIQVNLFGFQWVTLPFSFVIFIGFAVGVAYTIILMLPHEIKRRSTIRNLKNKLHVIESKIEEIKEKTSAPAEIVNEASSSPAPDLPEEKSEEKLSENKRNDEQEDFV